MYAGNPQKLFDDVVQHLRTQNAKSTTGVYCQYRMVNGLRCAVGGVLPDDLYDKSMECRGIRDLMVLRPSLADYFGNDNTELLSHLQMTHDRFEIQDWELSFKNLAHLYNLEYKASECVNTK